MNNLSGVQTSIYQALTTAPATYPVFDSVPQGVLKPYIVIGEWFGNPDDELATVTTDAAVNIYTWSAKSGKAETHAMLDFVRIRLDGQPVAGTWLCVEEDFDITEDPTSTASARIWRGRARYELHVEDGAFLPPLGQFDMEQFA